MPTRVLTPEAVFHEFLDYDIMFYTFGLSTSYFEVQKKLQLIINADKMLVSCEFLGKRNVAP